MWLFRATPQLSFLGQQKREAKTDSEQKSTIEPKQKSTVPAERKRSQKLLKRSFETGPRK